MVEKCQGISFANQNYVNNNSYKRFSNSTNALERVPAQDTTSFSGNENLLSDCDVEVNNGFLGVGKRKIKGSINGVPVELKLDTGAFNNKVKLSGVVDGRPIDLQLKDYKLTGNISDEDKKLLPYLQRFMIDKRNYDEMMAAVAVCV